MHGQKDDERLMKLAIEKNKGWHSKGQTHLAHAL